MSLFSLVVMIAKLEQVISLIVYFAFNTHRCDLAHSPMNKINKIYLQMLLQRRQRANLICSFS